MLVVQFHHSLREQRQAHNVRTGVLGMIYVATDRALRVQIEEVDGHERHCQGGMKRWGSRQSTQLVVHSIAPPAGKVASASRSIIARFAREKRRAGFCSSRYWAATPSKWPGSYGLP